MQASLSKEYCLSNKEALVPSLPHEEVTRFYLEKDKKKDLRVSGVPEGWLSHQQASESSLALVSRTYIKTFEILPIQANFRTSGSLNL